MFHRIDSFQECTKLSHCQSQRWVMHGQSQLVPLGQIRNSAAAFSSSPLTHKYQTVVLISLQVHLVRLSTAKNFEKLLKTKMK